MAREPAPEKALVREKASVPALVRVPASVQGLEPEWQQTWR